MSLHLRSDRGIILYLTTCIMIFEFVVPNRNEAEIIFVDDSNSILTSWDSHETTDIGVNFTIETAGCTIPGLRTLDESIEKLLHFSENVTSCLNSDHPLLGSNKSTIFTIFENYEYYGITNTKYLSCCYKPFYRPPLSSEFGFKEFNKQVKYLECINFRKTIEVEHEFVKVICSYKKKIIYHQFFVFAPKNPFTASRMDSIETPGAQSSYNIIIMGIGSMSRLNFIRTMPNTYKALKASNAIEFLGYHAVADNTFQNFIPILAGMNQTELNKACWLDDNYALASCPLIWNRFKDVGYKTFLLEDTARSGVFNSRTFQFHGDPTDYYIQTFLRECERNSIMNKNTLDTNNSKLCMGSKYYFNVVLEYIESLAANLGSSKTFGLFWESSMSEEHLNAGMVMDQYYESLIKELNETSYLKETMLILLSDHGINFGNIVQTKQGRLEQRLPFVYVLVPKNFRETYKLAYKNMKANSHRLTTPYDMHTTLVDLINTDSITDDEIINRSRSSYGLSRGISLFLPIPLNRTCNAAGIGEEWCTCYHNKELPVDTAVVREGADFLIRHMNSFLKHHPHCAPLSVDKIMFAKELSPSYAWENEWREFVLTVQAAPGGGVFAATLRRSSDRWTIEGTIRRVNLYINNCVDYYPLKPYCHCQ